MRSNLNLYRKLFTASSSPYSAFSVTILQNKKAQAIVSLEPPLEGFPFSVLRFFGGGSCLSNNLFLHVGGNTAVMEELHTKDTTTLSH